VSDDCPRDDLTIPHEDVSLSNYVYSFVNNAKYHRRYPDVAKDVSDAAIDIISVNTSQILLTTTTTASWDSVQFAKNPELYSSFLWGHSIKRGKHTRFLVWKRDSSFSMFWERFMKAHINQLFGESVQGETKHTSLRQELIGKIQKHKMKKG
jgi:hypothetical protein